MIIKPKSNLYVGPVNIFPLFYTVAYNQISKWPKQAIIM